jgi:putative membrane-bound dehydrogenase-like protein
LNYVTGIEVGFGGAWVMSPPCFYFIPDRDGNDVPDSEPQVLLDGFGNHANAHNLANGFAWGPDGWLYGTHGRTNWSMVGKPGTPDSQRVRFDGGVYRYHPVRHVWEPFADGTTNPWGIDWDDYGQAFVCNCVNPHLFHVIQGAHYEPWRNRESSQYAYERLATIADHLHFTGGADVHQGLGTAEEDAAGGGHAHCGTMVYLGDNWPDRYRNTVFMNNIHGRRVNNDILRRAGSGYIAVHAPDLMISRDQWYMGVNLQYGPDGSVFASDWSDTGECHSVTNTQRQTGRIYKISFGTPSRVTPDLARLSDRELVELQLHRNDWFVRHARRLLQERAAQGKDMSVGQSSLRQMFTAQAKIPQKLRAFWALYVTGGVDDNFLMEQLNHGDEHIRAWAIRLLCEGAPSTKALTRFNGLAAQDSSALVRLQLAITLQRLSLENRWPLAQALLARGEDANDANLPLMLWYGIAPLVTDDRSRFISLAAAAKFPIVRRHIARRVASSTWVHEGLNDFSVMLSQIAAEYPRAGEAVRPERKQLADSTDQRRLDILTGVLQGLEGRRSVDLPRDWPAAYRSLMLSLNDEVRERTLDLALIFDDPEATRLLRSRATDSAASADLRNRAIQALVAKKDAELGPLLLELIKDPATRSSAIRGLAEYNIPITDTAILDNYATFDPATRQDALQTLASRGTWASVLINAVESGRIPRADVSTYTVRQVQNLRDERLNARLSAIWGQIRTAAADKGRLISSYKRRLTPELLQRGDRTAGRALFEKNCANCHRLFDSGGNIGPEITGSQRTNLDYLLENLIDPSAAVVKDYQMQAIETKTGRLITGLVVAETEIAVTIQTINEKIVLPVSEIEQRSLSPVSMMPDGILQLLTMDQVRDLIAYLAGPTQVPLGK